MVDVTAADSTRQRRKRPPRKPKESVSTLETQGLTLEHTPRKSAQARQDHKKGHHKLKHVQHAATSPSKANEPVLRDMDTQPVLQTTDETIERGAQRSFRNRRVRHSKAEMPAITTTKFQAPHDPFDIASKTSETLAYEDLSPATTLNSRPPQQRVRRRRNNQTLPELFTAPGSQLITRGPYGRVTFLTSTILPLTPVIVPVIIAEPLYQTQVLKVRSISPVVVPKEKKKPFFEVYYTSDQVTTGLKDGSLFSGTLRINQKARRDAWVTVDGQFAGGDVLIEGEKHRNRALNGDRVSIKLIEHEGDKIKGQVVFVLEARPLKQIAGFLRPPGFEFGQKEQDIRKLIANDDNKQSCQFHPQDTRIPFITINRRDLPRNLQGPNWVFNILQKQNVIFSATMEVWSHEARFPRGRIIDEVGNIGNIQAETAAILIDCDVDARDHPTSALACLPAIPWKISPEEIAKRRDFRNDRVCTIDPETARDLDDALSVRKLEDGNFEIGVHIADVAHFIEQDSALDKVAQQRATTVYLVQKAIPMLPRLLCEELCSLNPAVDRLAFSVTWTMNENGEEVGPRWYGRSIIRSCVRFAYGEAQNLLDGKSWAEGVGKPIDGGHTEEEVTNDIKVLLKMSKAMRAKRFENGALTINAFKLNFKLNKDGLPGVAEVYQLKDANRLIEEFMLKANISVAEKIVDAFPAHALLRMHPRPKERPLKEFTNYASKLGIHIDCSSSATLQQGFNELAAMAKDNPMVAVLQNNAVRSMRRAEYICTGLHEDPESWAHYALAVPLYTHFTSPIRRYADVVVHRLLDHALKAEDAGFESETCEVWAKNCNVRKDNARTAQERSSMLYLCAYIEEHCRNNCLEDGMEVDAIVVAVRDRSIDVVIPSMALDRRIYYDDTDNIESFVHDADNETTEIKWITETMANMSLKTIKVMDQIKVYLRGDFSVSPCEVIARLR